MILIPLLPEDKAYKEHCTNCGHFTDHSLEYCKIDFKTKKLHLEITCDKCKGEPSAFKRVIIQDVNL